MTAETDIAAIDDGGANTAAEVRTALTSVLGRGDGAPINHALRATYTLSNDGDSGSAQRQEQPHARLTDTDSDWDNTEPGASTDGQGKLNDGHIARPWGPAADDLYDVGDFVLWQANPVIRFDLGSAKIIDEMRAYGVHGDDGVDVPNAVHLEYSDNDSAYTTAVNKTGLTDLADVNVFRAWQVLFDTGETTAHRYWRVTLTRQASFVACSEIELWGRTE